MSELQKVEIGQVWRSKDWRDHGKTKRVIHLTRSELTNTGGGFAVMQGEVRSTIRFSTLRKRYTLVKEALDV